MKRFLKCVLTAIVAAAVFGSPAVAAEGQGKAAKAGKKGEAGSERRAQGGHPGQGEGGGHPGGPFSIEALTRRLDLNDAQKSKMKVVLMEYEKDQILSEARGRVAELEYAQLLDETSPDLAKIEVKVREIGMIQTESRLVRIRSLLETKSFLTPEQFGRLKTMVSRMSSDKPGMRAGQQEGQEREMRPRHDRDGDDRPPQRRRRGDSGEGED